MSSIEPIPPDMFGLLTAFIISLVSGFISIAQRIARGREASLLWVTSEFFSAILCGYLMYDAYPIATNYLPDWVSQPVATAVAAHMGGRMFQGMEAAVTARYKSLFGDASKKSR